MTGLPAKFAKMGFSKGWKAYRGKKKTKSKIATKKTRKRTKNKTKSRIKKSARLPDVFKKFRTTRRKRGIGMAKGKKSAMLDQAKEIGIGTAGAIGGKAISNMIPIADPRIKSIIPILAGMIIALMAKGKNAAMLKSAGIGMAIGGSVSAAKTFFPNVALLAGEDTAQIAYTPDDVEQAVITGQITPEEGAELLGIPEGFAGDDDEMPADEATSETWQTTENEL